MAFDPYDPCPCGSGKKFRWCCQPVYGQIDQAFQQEAQGQHEAALRIMQTLCKDHAGNPEVWGRTAQLLYQGNKVDDAENALQKAFDINPNYPFGHYLRGRFRQLEGEIPGALLLFRKAAELYDPVAKDILSHLYSLITESELKLNRPVAARAALELAAKMEPANTDYTSALEQLFGKESNLPAGASKSYEYRKLAADAPAERRAAWQRALHSAGTGKLGDAARAFDQLTTEDANDSAAWFNLGLTRAWLGDNAGAIAALDRSVHLDQDEEQAAESWLLAEVMLCGHGMEEQANFVEHSAMFQVRDPNRLVEMLQTLQRDRRMINMQTREQEGILTGMLLEKVQGLTPQHAASKMPRIGAYLLVMNNIVRLWNVHKEMFDATLAEITQLSAGALSDPHVRVSPAHFAEILNEALSFALNSQDDAENKQRMLDAFQGYMEEKWIHQPLRSLGNIPPIDAAGHHLLRKKLRGLIRFVEECNVGINLGYDFNRLRRKLGLLAEPGASASTAPGRDFKAMGAAELAGLDIASLSDAELEDAHQCALKLGAADLGGKFASALVARPPRADKPDRYLLFNQLVQQALNDGQTDAALDYINQGDKADSDHNEGRRRHDYALRRGQIHVKRGEIDQAAEVFERLIESAPSELRYRGTAAEAMLAVKRAAKALSFAEGGLKKSREQNNRDSEQYFLELTAAAKKQGA